MKRMILSALVLNAALLGIIAYEFTALAGGGEPTAEENGDVNGDGGRNLTDAIYMLSWLFRGGPGPVPLARAQEGGGLSPEQEEIFEHLSMVDLPVDDAGNTVRTLRVTGVNLQVVNGLGVTWGNTAAENNFLAEENDLGRHRVNGTGNLIVGYQELRQADGDDDTDDGNDRTGSHNLVIGSGNNYTFWGSQVVGNRNTVAGYFSTVSGGSHNVANGEGATVSGGIANYAVGTSTSIGGGEFNDAVDSGATVAGGIINTASGYGSVVGGGEYNVASGEVSAVGGGGGVDSAGQSYGNEASGLGTVISGGGGNVAEGPGSVISGGDLNSATGEYSTVSGGNENRASGAAATVSGGSSRTAGANSQHVP